MFWTNVLVAFRLDLLLEKRQQDFEVRIFEDEPHENDEQTRGKLAMCDLQMDEMNYDILYTKGYCVHVHVVESKT